MKIELKNYTAEQLEAMLEAGEIREFDILSAVLAVLKECREQVEAICRRQN